jgi:hypothetical protein
MFFIPGELISLITFPGVIVHEAAHRFFCDLAKVEVYEVAYFRVGNPAGYVIHGPTKDLKSALLISIGPLIVNTTLCALLTFSAMFPIVILEVEKYNFVFKVLIWLGFSIGMHAFPSNHDIENFIQEVKTVRGWGILLICAKLFAVLLRIANCLRIIWFDAIYAFGISMFLPWLFGYI